MFRAEKKGFQFFHELTMYAKIEVKEAISYALSQT